jgi:hypothetical protein
MFRHKLLDIFRELVSFLACAHILKKLTNPLKLSSILGRNISEHLLTNKNVVEQIGVKTYILNLVAWKMYSITLVFKTFPLNRQHHIQSKYEIE